MGGVACRMSAASDATPSPRCQENHLVTIGYEGAPPDPGGPVDPVVRTQPVDEVDRPAWFTLMAPGWWPPDGSVTQASGLCFDPGGRVVLVQLDDGFWTLPGGEVEPDETPLDTLLREVA
jgi:NUDIX domain